MKSLVGSGNKDLDLILGGGFQPQTILLIGGITGSGKTTLAHQILFANLTKELRAVYLTILGKSIHKTLRSIEKFEFFNPEILMHSLLYEDLGEVIGREGLKKILDYVFHTITTLAPDFLCIEGIHRFRSMSASEAEYLSFLYELSGIISASPTSCLWTGMFTESNLSVSQEAGVADHVLYLSTTDEGIRHLKVMKLAEGHSVSEPYTYSITERGLRIDSAKFAKRPLFSPPEEITKFGS